METITGIEIYPLISFIIFTIFFIGVTILVWRSDKKYITELSNLPLDK